ncbi:ferric reductase NAD binding domain-containing protein [Tricharina praecox]|uniref:ferric reductase NAD binding domain-containing protein n=1 Tax=Tricharina praecox TaxID=43433 RepID=UPI00221F3473|nr:ferric reductase NAD binding domain-containing protein [Tricharina praecox]KAI5850107.1 ferric reductase NAD binding domain-containing protein [Tricharina praecox]
MATVNMIPLFVCMMRNNYVGKAVGVPFNTWNLYHRWAGRIVALESFAHMGAWTVNQVDHSNWAGVGVAIKGSLFFQMGLMAEIALFFLIFLSLSPLRHAHYQIFLATHQLCIAFFLVGAWLHCHIDELPHEKFVNIAIGIWAFERLHRLVTIYRKNVRLGKGWSLNSAEVKVAPAGEDAVRVSITMKKGWEFKPGQHAYLYVPRLSWTQSHPFSIAWSTTTPSLAEVQMQPLEVSSTTSLAHRNLLTSKPRTTIHFVISRRHGFTGRLYREAYKAAHSTDPEKVDIAPKRFLAFVEGPYCNEAHSFDSFSSLLFVAGGSGITHPLGYIRHLLVASSEGLVAARRIKLAWVVRNSRNISWVSDWLEELWRLDARRGMLEVEIYVTRPCSQYDTDMSGGPRVKWFAGRPQMEVILAGMLAPTRMRGGRGALAVNVCGPGSLADNVRAAVRERVDEARIEFSEESFTWS